MRVETEEDNPFTPVPSFDIVIFGATGDLSQRKLIPALFHRWRDGQIPSTSRIIAASRQIDDRDAFLQDCTGFLETGKDNFASDWQRFSQLIHCVSIDVTSDEYGWNELRETLDGGADKVRLFYFSLPPSIYGPASDQLASHDLVTLKSRVVLEKPIGHDFHSARAINERVRKVFDESAIFRIDHYLGKETVQNLLILRFANYLFEPLWNANGIDHVQITVAETLGVGGRADYYDLSGALRDMMQNHLLQLLCLVAMEPPANLEADTVRTEKRKVLRALRAINTQNVKDLVVRGQYSAGAVNGEAVPGYEEELGRESNTETFVAIKAEVENWRWAGVPFYLRTGKRMQERRSEIIIQFKDVPHDIVQANSGRLHPNRLVLRLQPDEGVKLMLMTKEPGPGGMHLRYVPLNLSYADTFKRRYPDAYERLLMAVVRGNLSLFMRGDEVEAAWRFVDSVVQAWNEADLDMDKYPAGVDGPSSSDVLIARSDREWYHGKKR